MSKTIFYKTAVRKPLFVQIVKATSNKYWYASHIGEVYEISDEYNAFTEKYLTKDNGYYIDIEDAKKIEMNDFTESVPEPIFITFEPVLVRDSEGEEWKPRFFDRKTGDKEYYVIGSSLIYFQYCIPYSGNEHLAHQK